MVKSFRISFFRSESVTPKCQMIEYPLRDLAREASCSNPKTVQDSTINTTLKYNPQNDRAAKPDSELALPHALTVTLIVTRSRGADNTCGFHSFLTNRFSSLLSSASPPSTRVTTRRDRLASNEKATSSGTTMARPFVPTCVPAPWVLKIPGLHWRLTVSHSR